MKQFPSDTATRAIVEHAAAAVGADIAAPINIPTIEELCDFLMAERQAGDAFTVEPERDLGEEFPGRSGVFTIRNNRSNTGAAVFIDGRGNLGWEF
jgi:hypothetical protein